MSEVLGRQIDAAVTSWRVPRSEASWRARLFVAVLNLVNAALRRSVGVGSSKAFDVVSARKRAKFLENIIAMVPPHTHFDVAQNAPVSGEWVSVAKSPAADRTLLYVHGGSFILERSDVHNALIARICKETGARAFILDYRLAPEHPFPAGIEDVKAAYRWLMKEGVDPSRLGIVADSAGGGLALAALTSLRDDAVPMPAAMALLGPWVDLTLSGDSILSNMQNEAMVSTLEGVNICKRLYLQGHEAVDPLASPLFADLSHLPPTLIHVGAPEMLRDDSTRLAQRMRDAGGQAWCDVYPRMPHVWHRLGPLLPETRCSIIEIAEFICEMIPEPHRLQKSGTG
ncbi:MAG: alpha/beta hydrolase fold domain-containing protein [Rhizobiales bacterium]|nr:alpha/beta hydrolase fold domain-containing protein [Hyphomicrobiales bacterium]